MPIFAHPTPRSMRSRRRGRRRSRSRTCSSTEHAVGSITDAAIIRRPGAFIGRGVTVGSLAGQMQDCIDDFTRRFVGNLARQAATSP